MAERVSFTCPLPPTALRRNSETRSHNYRAALVREYQEQVWCAGYAEVGAPWAHPSTFYNTKRPVVRGMAVTSTGPTNAIFLPWEKAHLTLVWRHHRAGPDPDNALASCKWLIDVLKATGPRPLGIIVDDDPRCLTVRLSTEKVQRKADEGVLVEISRRE